MTFSYASLFSGAGGLDIGLERAGLELVSMCEIEPVFCKTIGANAGWLHSDGAIYFRSAKIINADVREVSHTELYSGADLDLLVGGPPCQAFSSSGKQLSVLDPRGALISEFYRMVAALRPKMFLFENVRGLVTARDRNGEPGGVITELIEILEDIGYSCRAALLNSADYGSYQRRVRCFILGSRNGTAPRFPAQTHYKDARLFGSQWRNLHQFLSCYCDDDRESYQYPSQRLAQELSQVSDGSGLKSNGRAEPTRPGGHWGYRQGTFIADLKLPARTVTGSASQDWVRWGGELRRLTLTEVKLLQGFPADWIVIGSKSQQYKQIGNAVPSIFGELLGRTIVSHLSTYPYGESSTRLGMPDSFRGYIEYTKRDHARNKSARKVHEYFDSASTPLSL